ncbi:MAG: glycosyltransferase family 9 protein [Bacteroidota bacterium]
MTMPATTWQSARRILAIRLDNMGDVLMTTPALRALRAAAPDRHVTLLASPTGAVLAPFIPEIDAVAVLAGSPWLPGGAAAPRDLEASVDLLRQAHFDAAVIFTVYSQNPLPAAMLCWQAGIPLCLAHCRENPYRLLSDWVPEPEPHEILRHEVRRQLDLVATVGASTTNERLSFRLRPEDEVKAMASLWQVGLDPQRPRVVLHPGASAAARRYPPEQFATLVDLLSGHPDIQLVFTGNAAEVELVDGIRRRLRRPVASLAGVLNLGELATVIAGAAVLVANNSGVVHIAAALGTPVVDIYALTNPQHIPWGVPNRVLYHDVPCRFCYRSACPQGHHDCLRLLEPQRVARAARELLDGGADCAVLN